MVHGAQQVNSCGCSAATAADGARSCWPGACGASNSFRVARVEDGLSAKLLPREAVTGERFEGSSAVRSKRVRATMPGAVSATPGKRVRYWLVSIQWIQNKHDRRRWRY